MTYTTVVRNRARAIQRNFRAQAEDYFAMCAEYRREGFSPRYCVHGVNMWVDYDCACFECEDGGWDADTLMDFPFTRAVVMARDEWADIHATMLALTEEKEEAIQRDLKRGLTRDESIILLGWVFQDREEILAERMVKYLAK